ncbi:DMT family transporter [Natrarchaeobius halalkaliphilus]|uniref:DMT family transporter n=1 Tax=Natrarchaeobius halalkaliphilus TaxID=1679091 RepID=A0A3N6LVK6_9EURY|nr:DMT family transporter [Natrarchaeobius halalkaliphilus]RQG92777.1 DMT family transporter [Natrarchaeobius halalkaliphilus]
MNSNRDILLFVALAVAWGTAFSAIEIGLETLPPLLFAALRFDVAAVVFAALVVALRTEWRPQARADWLAIVVGGVLLVGVHFGLLFVGQSYVSSAVSAIVMSLIPIVTPLIALAVLPRTRIRAPVVAGLVVGLAGIVVIAVSGGSLAGHGLGIALLFVAALSFAVGSVLIERIQGTLPVVSLQAWAMALGAFILHALSAVHPGEHVSSVTVTPATLGALAYLGVVSTGGAFFLYFVLLERVGATEISLVNYAAPIVAAVFGWAVLGESITVATVAGFALIVTGFALCKIDAVWRLLGPAIGYGPGRTPTETDDVVVGSNVYVAHAGEERHRDRRSERTGRTSNGSPCAD